MDQGIDGFWNDMNEPLFLLGKKSETCDGRSDISERGKI
ncbi:hypothetical protein C823_007927 [Eubacterium plexicaudatum ASF492]|nr:hypothetical protein C823_007927 [Eubacterium plexicaudatum ASF492]